MFFPELSCLAPSSLDSLTDTPNRPDCRTSGHTTGTGIGLSALVRLDMEARKLICKNAIFTAFIWGTSSMATWAEPSFQQTGNLLVMSNGNVQVQYNLNAGKAAFLWQNSQKISAFYAGVGLSSGYVTGNNFSNRTWSVVSNNEVSVTAYAAGLPTMTQYFTLDQNDSFLTSVTMSGTNASANWMGPVVVSTTGGVDI